MIDAEWKDILMKEIDMAWKHGAMSGMKVVKDGLLNAADIMPDKKLTKDSIDYIVTGMMEINK